MQSSVDSQLWQNLPEGSRLNSTSLGETQTKKAQSDLAYELQSAKTQQRIKEETMQIKVHIALRAEMILLPTFILHSPKLRAHSLLFWIYNSKLLVINNK